MSLPAWEAYVARLCVDRWSLDPASLIKMMAHIEALVESGDVTHHSVATVLRVAGISTSDVEFFAPRICATIETTFGQSHTRW